MGRTRQRAMSANGFIATEFFVKLFPAVGRAVTIPGRVRNSSSTFQGSVTGTVSGTEGARMQVYWKFQYDLDIGNFSRLSRIRGIGELANTRVAGLYNVIQSFDLEPPTRPGGGHTAHFRNRRGDHRPRGSAAWTWQLSHNRTVRRADVVTTTEAKLPVAFSGALSAATSASVGADLGWELGPALTVGGSVGAETGASINIDFRRDYELRLIGNVHITSE